VTRTPNDALDRTAMSAVVSVIADSRLVPALTAVGQHGRWEVARDMTHSAGQQE
jgi:hypothetical protein